MTTRLATASDAALLAALHGQCFTDHWSADAFERLLQEQTSLALLATDPEPNAFVLIRIAADEAEILSLGVRPQSRRRGLARQLTRAGAERATHHGACRLFLEVNVNNEAALGLYRQLGFAEVGRRPGYYRGVSEPAQDALILSRSLPFPAWESAANSTNLQA